ncbi:hypothetical protein RUM44_006762 [Polyplax serrata]|uniref:Mitochondrial import inner membrane translocase subunit Tim29 n=1 Tax=Polyplax serrata TaxID=468196 RepID=A0ABR1AKQ0_POLSC
MLTSVRQNMLTSLSYLSKFTEIFKIPPKFVFQVPEKAKGTVVEKWIKYWEGLINDYVEVFRDTLHEGRTKPYKTAAIAAAGSFFTYAVYNNPTEQDYRDGVIYYQNLFGLVGKSVRNPGADVYLKTLEKAFNHKLIRRLSLGICCFMWIDNYDNALGIYKSQCEYLKPRYTNFHERIIDFGFLNKFWMLDRKMEDYDVNPNEWIDFSKADYDYKKRIL